MKKILIAIFLPVASWTLAIVVFFPRISDGVILGLMSFFLLAQTIVGVVEIRRQFVKMSKLDAS
jgi:hypothetical protein